jgi:single-stranded-DNA-specific exonuclease
MPEPIASIERRFRQRPVPEGPHTLPADLHPVLQRVYLARGVTSAAELDYSLERLAPPALLKGIGEATALLAEALAREARILVVADFDADGATSCALLVRALALFGAAPGQVRYLVPNRFEYGYGLTPEIVALAARQAPDLLVTVDNGISSVEGVVAARDHGIKVLITDHHLPGARLPPADAIVNPNQPGDGFPGKHLAGVGVAFYLAAALRARLRETGWFARRGLSEPNLARLLDLVALGTVADVVPLDHLNRILVAQGLARLRAGDGIADTGLRALLRVAGRDPARVTAADLGYAVAPRLNAAGRLADMSLGIACLLSDDPGEAESHACRLDALNRERRSIESTMQAEALAAIEALKLDRGGGGGLPRGLCLFDESWHQGVIGLVAARVKERVHRPVIAFAPAGEAILKGSARSIEGLHVRDALDNIAARYPGLLTKFGGHAMAAGLSLARADFERFREVFDEEVGRWLSDEAFEPILYTDGELAAEDFTLALAEQLRAAGPWGQGFPEPIFEGIFEVLETRLVGERHLKLWLRPSPGGRRTLGAIAFRQAGMPAARRVRAAYRLDVNEYQGTRALELVVEHLEPLPE